MIMIKAKSHPALTRGIFQRSWRMFIRCIIHPLDSVRQVGEAISHLHEVGRGKPGRGSESVLTHVPIVSQLESLV